MATDDYQIQIRRPGAEPEVVLLDKNAPCTLGRSPQCRVFLSDASISRNHAEIFWRDGSFWIQDLGSKNGTKLGNKKIEGPHPLKAGDQLHLGSVHLSFGKAGESPSHETSVSARIADIAAPVNVHAVPLEDISSGSVALDTRSFGSSLSPERVGNFLQAMDRVGQALLAYRPLDELFQFVVGLAADVLRADRTAILLRRASDDDLVTMAVSQSGRGAGEEIIVSRSIARMAVGQRQAILTSDAQSDTRFKEQQSVIRQRIHSAMCAPLWHDGDVLGLLYVDNVAAPVPFEEGDLRLLTFIAHLAAVKIRETESHEKDLEREEELRRAAALQQALLPHEPRVVGVVEVAGRNVPSLNVGGDYFDFVDGGEGRMVVGLGDVAGKGMPAALLMTHLAASVRAQVETERPLLEVMTRLNKSIYQNVRGERFITLVLAEIDTATGAIRYVNGGHNPPYLLRSGTNEIETLTEGGLLLGIMPEAKYAQGTVTMNPGDILLFYSDGVTEARNLAEEEFGEDRLMAFIREARALTPAQMVETLIERVRDFSRRPKPTDDVTVVSVRRA
ncbi:MAG TPA: SpoIIE family protein phosphatase [Candidatus Eisenbacteria bacterium]|nr:SpoIIE family protein phosphatase [Candidatus Eisenbacteria bacterium]